jgi:hypothetical protein
MCGKVSSDWLPSYIKAAKAVLEIFKIAEYLLYGTDIVKSRIHRPDRSSD